MKTTKTKNGLIVAIAVFAVAMMATPLQNADAFLQKSASSEYITWGDGAKSFASLSIFGDDPNEPTRPGFGVSLVDYVGDEDEDINVSFTGREDTTDKQDLLVQPVTTSRDDVSQYCVSWSFWNPIPRDCIKDTVFAEQVTRPSVSPCLEFNGIVC